MQDISPIPPPNKDRRQHFEREAKRVAGVLWRDPVGNNVVEALRQALETAYVTGRSDEAFNRRRSAA